MGRDMIILQTWQDTGKPPLLGPQTSALPFNQSAIYFYLLYPGFLISDGNPVSSLYTLAFVYIVSLLIGLYLLRHDRKIIICTLISFYLLSIHPQYITQGRFVWNPSFVTPFLIISIISFYLLFKNFTIPKLLFFSFSIALAVSLSYSVAPLLIMFFVYWLIFNRKHLLSIVLWLSSAIALINLPTIIFELRHGFFLTKAFLTQSSPVQQGLDFATKSHQLSQFIFSTPNNFINQLLLGLTLILCIYLLYFNRKNVFSFQYITSFLFLSLTFLSYLLPIGIQPHYIFAFTTLLFLIIASLPNITIIVVLILLSITYLQPNQTREYFKPASRTYNQMQQCFQQYCDMFKQPSFVSVQSGFLPFHNGPEHRYLLKQAGCNIKDIETENGLANYMTVVVDNSTFDDNTKYYELDLFGKFKTISTLDCLPNFQIKTLEKLN